jgi:phosphatidylinositol alpha-1,6-mannosyltransferase
VREVMPRLGPGVRYWLAGDGPEAAAIAHAIGEAGAGDRVLTLGAIGEAQLGALYRGADVFVMPNVPIAHDIEGFGLVLIEANLHGLPVVAADLEGPAEVISEGRNGRLVRPLDAEAFARVIGELRCDPAGRHALAARAETYAREHIGWAPVAERHVQVLRAAARMAQRDAGAQRSRRLAFSG